MIQVKNNSHPVGIHPIKVIHVKSVYSKGKEKVMVVCRGINPLFAKKNQILRSFIPRSIECRTFYESLGASFDPQSLQSIVGVMFEAELKIGKKGFINIERVVGLIKSDQELIIRPHSQSTDWKKGYGR